MNTSGADIKRTVGVAILVAVVVVLQMFGSYFKIGAFSFSFVLVPIVIGAAVFGQATGAFLGGVFGVVVLINCVSGADAGGAMLWAANPPLTAALCLIKGVLAGFAAGAVYSAARKNKYAGVLLAAVACPVVNTGFFLAALYALYRDTLTVWAGGSNLFYYLFVGVAGVNFIIELLVNVILCPAITRIIEAVDL